MSDSTVNCGANAPQPTLSLEGRGVFGAALVAALWWTVSVSAGAEELALLEEQAIRAAAARVAPCVVRIEMIGGLERVESVRFGGGTSGLIVSREGHIVTSAAEFARQPTSILVTIPGHGRLPARLVATDHSRAISLLKVDAPASLPVPRVVPEAEIQVGQWAIALGRAIDADTPSISVGIISATDRIWGKSLQTDAKVSPNNYGGALADLHGRVYGVLLPLSPDGGELAGWQWYDSGIGFAVPLEHIASVLPRLAQGDDLHAGVLGLSFHGKGAADPALVAASRVNSPAYRAGMKAGDRIVEVNGQSIDGAWQFRQRTGRLYASESVELVVLRGDQRLQKTLELVATIEPYERPFLGILPGRSVREVGDGVVVRYVYADSAAATAGIQVNDRVTAVAQHPVTDREGLSKLIAAAEFDKPLSLGVRRGDSTLNVEVRPGHAPNDVPAEVREARSRRDELPQDRPAVGRVEPRIPGSDRVCSLVVPGTYDPAAPYGVVIWFAADATAAAEAADQWEPLCDERDLLLLVVTPGDEGEWLPSDVPFARAAMDHLADTYNIDRARIAAGGYQAAGAMACLAAIRERELIRAVALHDAPLPAMPPENEPDFPLCFYLARPEGSAEAERIDAAALELRSMRYPVILRKLTNENGKLDADQLSELARWIDTLDGI